MNRIELEKYSSAITLSDMEIFVFPELMYSLVLANIMSPEIWKWREIDTFKKLKGKSKYRKFMRLKQFIMDEYEFNLDLETWGLTSQDKELSRFEDVISRDQIAKSNALFGYEGDQYYFDVDIRRHFGLDKYNSDIIPYWKTETVEAMNAFHLKQGYSKPAGECVSLSALYAAAAFVVCEIPLEDIYMILTPLHSQNFIDLNDGIITNNRRIVTKTMWFNGTAISNKAQRALRNEQVTIVAHSSGHIHCLYENATINKKDYAKFTHQLEEYLTSEVSVLTFANFLRCNHDWQKYFQFCCEECKGGPKYAKAEVLFHYEHGSKYRIADVDFEKLIDDVSDEDIVRYKYPKRICTRQLCSFVSYENIDIHKEAGRKALIDYLKPYIPQAGKMVDDLYEFLHITPKLPSDDKVFDQALPIKITPDQTREQIIDYLKSIRDNSQVADLAIYAYRDMSLCSWQPFVKAAIERNPVTLQMAGGKNINEVYKWLCEIPEDSIYAGPRLAQPDEVINYQTGDGLEKAFCLINCMKKQNHEQNIELKVNDDKVEVNADAKYEFFSSKGLNKTLTI